MFEGPPIDRPFINAEAKKTAKLFIGTEIEKNANYGLKTLFLQDVTDPHLHSSTIVTLVEQHSIEAVYLDYNYRFFRDETFSTSLKKCIAAISKLPVKLLLNIPFSEYALNWCIHNKPEHVHLVVTMPPSVSNENISVKFGCFSTTNGVFTYNFDDLPNNHFTEWSQYESDIDVTGE